MRDCQISDSGDFCCRDEGCLNEKLWVYSLVICICVLRHSDGVINWGGSAKDIGSILSS